MILRLLLKNRAGSGSAEFALVLPLLLVFLLGIVDAGRWMWTYNQAEKATQMGARMAAVVNPISSDVTASYLGACSPALTQGDLIPASCFTTITCTAGSCSSGTVDDDSFTKVVDRMRLFLPTLTEENVAIEYTGSGLGYAGNPNGPDASPLVTVKLGTPATPLEFRPITSVLILTMNMPSFTATLTTEDMAGQQSN